MDAGQTSVIEQITAARQRHESPFSRLSGLPLLAMVLRSPASPDRAALLERLEAARRAQALFASLESDLLLQLAGTQPQSISREVNGTFLAVRDEVVTEIALRTHQTEADVRSRLQTARTVDSALPAVQDAFREGRIDAPQVALIARTAERVPEAARTELQQLLLGPAQAMHVKDLQVAAEHAVRTVDPEGGDARRSRAARRRDVWTSADIDGNALLHARLAALDAEACLRLVTDAARNRRSTSDAAHLAAGLEPPTIGQLKVEAFVAQMLQPDAAQVPSTVVEVQVQVDLATLAALANEPVTVDGTARTDVVGLREFLSAADDVRFRRLLVDPATRAVLDCGEQTYRAPAALRRFIIARDGTCIVRGCQEPARSSDLDHAVPWQSGGATAAGNLNALCRRHHLLKTHANYVVQQNAAGEWQFVSPTPVREHPPDD